MILSILTSCADNGQLVTGTPHHKDVFVYGASISWDPFHGGMLIEDLKCPWNSIPLYLGDDLQDTATGREFVEVLRGKGRLGPLPKYVVIDGVVIAEGVLGAADRVELKQVKVLREVPYEPARAVDMEASKGCRNDTGHRQAWLDALQRKRR